MQRKKETEKQRDKDTYKSREKSESVLQVVQSRCATGKMRNSTWRPVPRDHRDTRIQTQGQTDRQTDGRTERQTDGQEAVENH